jgi:hypothetical protein
MKRDMDLVRQIMLAIEDQYIDTNIRGLKIDKYNLKTVGYHCKLLYDAGLIDYYYGVYADNELLDFLTGSLTWEGHEFLEAAKDDSRWKRAMEVVKEKGGNITIDILKQLLIQLMKNAFLG